MEQATTLQPETATERKLYPLDQTEFQVNIKGPAGQVLTHILRKPTLEELVNRDQGSVYETEEVKQGEETVRVDIERANAALWDKIAVKVKGYRSGALKTDQWIDVTPDIAAKIPGNHKSTAIDGMQSSNCSIDESDTDGFNLDGDVYIIKQEIGTGETPQYIVHHTLRQPTESERQEYRRKASQAVFVRGSKRNKAKIIINLKASVDLYDKLYVSIDGVSGQADVLRQIDPIWKRKAIAALMTAFESNLSD